VHRAACLPATWLSACLLRSHDLAVAATVTVRSTVVTVTLAQITASTIAVTVAAIVTPVRTRMELKV
jgi:hypothetical protein